MVLMLDGLDVGRPALRRDVCSCRLLAFAEHDVGWAESVGQAGIMLGTTQE